MLGPSLMLPDPHACLALSGKTLSGGKRYRIFLIDDHALVLEGLRHLINDCGDLVVCGWERSAAGAVRRVAKTKPDAIVVDISLERSCGLDLIRELHQVVPCVPVVVVTMHDELFYGIRALRAGASGYIMKSQSIEHLADALRAAARGGLYVSEALKREIARLRME